jgi:hypothetical protein
LADLLVVPVADQRAVRGHELAQPLGDLPELADDVREMGRQGRLA